MGFVRDSISGEVYQVNPGLGWISTLVALFLVNSILVGLAWFLLQFLDVPWWQVVLVTLAILVPFNALFLYYTRRNTRIKQLVELLKDPRTSDAAEEELIESFPSEQISRSIKNRRDLVLTAREGLSKIEDGFDDFEDIEGKIPREDKPARYKFLGSQFIRASEFIRKSVTPEVERYLSREFQEVEDKAREYIKEGNDLQRSEDRRQRAKERASRAERAFR